MRLLKAIKNQTTRIYIRPKEQSLHRFICSVFLRQPLGHSNLFFPPHRGNVKLAKATALWWAFFHPKMVRGVDRHWCNLISLNFAVLRIIIASTQFIGLLHTFERSTATNCHQHPPPPCSVTNQQLHFWPKNVEL